MSRSEGRIEPLPVQPLWERADALALLDRALRETSQAGRIVLVAGEAGGGKTALVSTFLASAASRARVLVGFCDPLATPRASGPLHDIGRQAGGALAEHLRHNAGPSVLFAALLDELANVHQRQPRVVVIEDVHWADEATLDLLIFLGRRIERLRVLLIITYRDDEIGAEHPLRAALAVLPRGPLRAAAVTPLSRDCVAEQATAAGLDPDEIFRLSGGNPLLLSELLAVGDGGMPATARELILARLSRLSTGARDLAQLVSVVPTGVEAGFFLGAEEQVDECLANGALVTRAETVSYRHELLRRAVEESLSPTRRVALHRRALAALAALDTVDGVDPARLVHHALRAGDVPALLQHGLAAAARAAAQGAHREAVAHSRSLRPYVGRLSALRRAEMLEAFSVEAYLAGFAAEGLAARRTALAEREQLGEPIAVGETWRWISRLAWWSGRGEEARAAAVRAVEVLERAGPSRELAMAYSNRSQLHMLASDVADAVMWGTRSRDLADQLGDVETSVHATINVLTAVRGRDDPDAEEGLIAAHHAAAAAGLVDHAARALVNRAASSVELRDFAKAGPALDDAFQYASDHELDGYVQYLVGVRSLRRLEQCDWDGALADARDSLAGAARAGVAVVKALVVRGRILAARGDGAALSSLDEAAEHANGTGELQWIGLTATARAEYFLLAGEPDRAFAEAERGVALATAKHHPWYTGELAYRLWLAGGPARLTPDTPAPYRLAMSGDWAGAADAWAARGALYARIEALSHGDEPAVGEALRAYQDLGAARAGERLRADLRRRGITRVPRGPRPTTVANAAGLTTRQLQVLALIAQGLTTADIAHRLSLSPKTVEHHISAVLAKLAVTTRGQAGAAAHRLKLLDPPT